MEGREDRVCMGTKKLHSPRNGLEIRVSTALTLPPDIPIPTLYLNTVLSLLKSYSKLEMRPRLDEWEGYFISLISEAIYSHKRYGNGLEMNSK